MGLYFNDYRTYSQQKPFKGRTQGHSLFSKYLMKKKAKLEDNFKKLKINLDSNIDRLIDGINLLRLQNNPINLNKNDIKTILLKSN